MNKYIRLQTLEEYGFKLKINFQDSFESKNLSALIASQQVFLKYLVSYSVFPIGFYFNDTTYIT